MTGRVDIIKSAILQKGEYYYTQMNKIFKSINNEQLKYNWLITNCECYCESVDDLLSKEYICMRCVYCI